VKNLMLSLFMVLLPVMVCGHRVYSQAMDIYVVSSSQSINARTCPRLDCAIATTIASGTEVQMLNTTHGSTVAGSDIWYRVEYNGEAVFVHSSLLTPHTTLVAASSVTVNQDNWIEYAHLGFEISLPDSWVNYTGNADYIDVLVSSTKLMMTGGDEQDTILYATYADTLIVVDPISQASVLVQPTYLGFDIDYSLFVDNCTDSVPNMTGSCEMIELPMGDALHGHFYNSAYDVHIYFVSRDRTQYIITVTVLTSSEDLLPIYQAIADSFTIETTQSVRDHSTASNGLAEAGENAGKLEVGRFAAWTYMGVPDELVTITVCESESVSANTPFDLYLVVRDPDGNVIAENDDTGLFFPNTNPSIDNLELLQHGAYTIEVHGVAGFTAGRYVLCVENGSNERDSM
jgi:hypothetical protein